MRLYFGILSLESKSLSGLRKIAKTKTINLEVIRFIASLCNKLKTNITLLEKKHIHNDFGNLF